METGRWRRAASYAPLLLRGRLVNIFVIVVLGFQRRYILKLRQRRLIRRLLISHFAVRDCPPPGREHLLLCDPARRVCLWCSGRLLCRRRPRARLCRHGRDGTRKCLSKMILWSWAAMVGVFHIPEPSPHCRDSHATRRPEAVAGSCGLSRVAVFTSRTDHLGRHAQVTNRRARPVMMGAWPQSIPDEPCYSSTETPIQARSVLSASHAPWRLRRLAIRRPERRLGRQRRFLAASMRHNVGPLRRPRRSSPSWPGRVVERRIR